MGIEKAELGDIVFVSYDCETTGLSAGKDRLVELAACKFRIDGQILGRFSSLIDPGIEITPELTAIHGIDNELVRGAPSAEPVILAFLDWAETGDGSPHEPLFVAHNAPFDIGFLQAVMADWGEHSLADAGFAYGVGPFRNNLRQEGGEIWWSWPAYQSICTLDLARKLWPHWKGHRLGQIAGRLGLDAQGWHRAEADVEMCRLIFEHIMGTWQLSSLSTLEGIPGLKFYDLIPAGLQHPEEGASKEELRLRLGTDLELVFSGSPSPVTTVIPFQFAEVDATQQDAINAAYDAVGADETAVEYRETLRQYSTEEVRAALYGSFEASADEVADTDEGPW